MRVDGWELPLSAIPLCQLFPCHLGPPRPTLSINLGQMLSWLHHWSLPHVHTIGVFSLSECGPDHWCQAAQVAHWTWWWQCLAVWHCRSVWSLHRHFAGGAGGLSFPYHRSLLSFRMQSRSLVPSRTSSSLDLVVTMSCGLTLQICLIITPSFRWRCWRFGFFNGQVSLAWSIALRTQELYTRPRVLKERWREERTGSRSLNFFQAVFKRVVVESSQPPAAESMSPR